MDDARQLALAEVAGEDTRLAGVVAGVRALARSNPLWQFESVAEVPQHGAAATELPQRAAALSITPALLAANAAGRIVVSAWIRSRPLGPVTILNGGLDLGVAAPDAGIRRLAAPAAAQARRVGPGEWASLLGERAARPAVPGGTVTGPDASRWHWLRYSPAFEPLTAELAGEEAVPGLRGAMGGSIEDCFEIFAGHPLAWLIHACPVADGATDGELARLAYLMPALRNKAGSAESHKLALERAEAWFREVSAWQPDGWWRVDVYVGAGDEAVARQAAAALTATPELRQSTYALVQGELCHAAAADPDGAAAAHDSRRQDGSPATQMPGGWASAAMLASLIRPPVREIPGVRVVKPPRFDLTSEVTGPVPIGDLLDANLLPCGQWSVPLASLNRHAFVCGATGSGKSQTVRTLLEALSMAEPAIPWLVIEPAKAEYAGMAGRLGPGKGLAVLKPGAPGLVPGGLNPLEPEPGFPLQTHIDLVQALFMAAFEAAEPFPQVLGRALLRCYQSRHWNLATGEPARTWRQHSADHAPAWPTLSDLQEAARQVVDEIGYGQEVADNVRGFIDVRIGSLRLGSPGRFFEGGHPLDIAALLRRNVVIELESIGSDADKAFLIGIVLIRLVEHLRVHRQNAAALLHLLVIEEAHRLLKNVPQGSPAAQAVSMFSDLLAEIRSYGEGVAVAEQIPSKIIPDVVKNSAVKIMHRLPAAEDREFVGATMNLDAPGAEYVVTLLPGMAAVHADGMDRPCLVRARFGGDREGGVADTLPPLVRSRYGECGETCAAPAARACTLREISAADEVAAASPQLALWLDAELVAHLIGGGYQLPAPGGAVFDPFRGAEPRTVECAIATLVHRGVDARYRALAEFYDPGLLGRHVTSAANRAVTRYLHGAPGEPATRECDGAEPAFQADQRRFVDLIVALTAMPPDAVISDELGASARERGARAIATGTTAARALELLRAHPWATYAGQRELYWGAGAAAPLGDAIRTLAGSASFPERAAITAAFRRLGFEPPEWLVSRLAPG